MAVVYNPVILKTIVEICAALGVSAEQVREWARQGAPIAVEGDGARRRYSAELAELQAWRARQTRRGHDIEDL